MYGVPIIASDVAGVRLFEKRGLWINFFEWPNTASLKQAILHVFESPAERRRSAWHNLHYCRGQMMDEVVSDYLDVIEALVAAREAPAPAGTEMPAAPRFR